MIVKKVPVRPTAHIQRITDLTGTSKELSVAMTQPNKHKIMLRRPQGM